MTLSVSLAGEDGPVLATQCQVLASLPGTFKLRAVGPGDVIAVDGSAPGWLQRAASAIGAGAYGVLVAPLGMAPAESVMELAGEAASAGAVVVVAPAFAADPAWTGSLGAVRSDAPSIALIESSATMASPPQRTPHVLGLSGLVLEQLALVSHLDLGPVGLEIAHESQEGYVAVGSAGAVIVQLAGQVSVFSGERLTLDLVGRTCRWSARFDLSSLAQPSEITRWDSTGAKMAPQVYESSYRRCWRELAAAIQNGEPVAHSLEHLAELVALVPLPA